MYYCFSLDIDLRKASKMFAQHFSCGSSVTGEDEVVIQGDVWEDILEFIPEKWPEVYVHAWLHKVLHLKSLIPH